MKTTPKKPENKLIPPTIVTFPGFPALVNQCIKALVGDDRLPYDLYPWNILSKKKPVLRGGADNEDNNNTLDLALLKEYISSLNYHVHTVLPEQESREKDLWAKCRVCTDNGDTVAYEKANAEMNKFYEEMHRIYRIQWLFENDGDSRLCKDSFYDRKGNSFFDSDTHIIVGWILMSAGVFDLKYFVKSIVSETSGFMPIDTLEAWKPMFRVHHMSNEFLCENTQFGLGILGLEMEPAGFIDYNANDDDAQSFTCFLSKGNIENWMHRLYNWGYTRESAWEFFGERGFFSNLFARTNFSTDFLYKDPVFAKTYIEGLLKPLFDEYFPVPLVPLDTIPTSSPPQKKSKKHRKNSKQDDSQKTPSQKK